jgi:hypothetical protein
LNTGSPASQPLHPEQLAGYGQPYAVYGYPPKPKASGLRIAMGVVAHAIAAFGILYVGVRLFTKTYAPSAPAAPWMNFRLIVGVLGCLVTGIVILAKQRKRGGAIPWLVGSFAILLVLACPGISADLHNSTPGAQAIMIPSALAVAVLATLVIVLEKKR